jgi:hypothetical protein
MVGQQLAWWGKRQCGISVTGDPSCALSSGLLEPDVPERAFLTGLAV